MDEEQRAAHDERMASYAATTAVAEAQHAIALSRTAETKLSSKRFDAAREDGRRHADAFASFAMNRAQRVAELGDALGASTAHRRGEGHV